MDVLDFDRCLVHEHAYGKRQSTEGHDVDRLACRPQKEHGGKKGKGDVRDNDQRPAPVSQEQQDN
jgi:hypothetical protein